MALKKLAGQTLTYGLSSILGRLLNYLLVPLYTRVFVPEEYGVVTEMYAYVTFLIILFTYGMETAFFRFSRTEDKDKVYGTALGSLFFSSAFLAGILILFNSQIADLLHYPGKGNYIVWFAIILGADAITSIPFARLRQQERPMRFALLKLFNICTNILFNLFFILLCPYLLKTGEYDWISRIYNPELGVAYVFLSNLFASILTVILLIPEMKVKKFNFDKKLWGEMLVYSLPLLVAGFAGMINETLDRILLKYLLSDSTNALAELGIYGAAYKLSIFMTLFVQTFRYAVEPFYFSQADKGDSRETYAKVMGLFTMAGAFIYLGVMVFIDVVKYFIGPAYFSGLDVVPILLLANLFLGIFFNLSIWYKLENKTKYGARLAIFGAVITIALNLLLIPKMGYMGAAWTTLVCYASMMVVSWMIGQKHYPVNYPLKKMGFYLAFAIVLVALRNLLVENMDLSLSANIILGLILCLLFALPAWRMESPKKIVP